jgi:hypothetical protein
MRHTTTTDATPLLRVVDAYVTDLVGYPFTDWLLDQRDAGYSYQGIAARLKERTGGIVDVSYRTIARWLNDAERKAS